MKNYISSFYNITAASIDRYLQLNSWNRDYRFANKNMMVYTNSRSEYPTTIAIPANEDYDDFFIILCNVIEILAKSEKRTVNEIIKDINTTFTDRLEFRVVSEMTDDGKIPLEYASSCIEGLKELVLYSICAEQSAKPICYRATDSAKSLLDKFKLAQTEKGSFVLNIDIQVVDERNEQITFSAYEAPMPFEHKVVERISTAISQIDAIVKKEYQLTETAESAYENGITANMCDALLKIRPQSDNDRISTTIRYASSLTNKPGIIEHIDMNMDHFSVIDELSKIYHDNKAVQDANLIGIIRSLSKKKGIDGELQEIKLYTMFEDAPRTVTIILSDEQYRIACDAHRDGIEVEVSGELDMSDRYWIMKNITYFAVAYNN